FCGHRTRQALWPSSSSIDPAVLKQNTPASTSRSGTRGAGHCALRLHQGYESTGAHRAGGGGSDRPRNRADERPAGPAFPAPDGHGRCAAFRLQEGALLTGSLEWAAHTGPGTKLTREAVLALQGSYTLTWRDYTTIAASHTSQERFRYLLVRVDP